MLDEKAKSLSKYRLDKSKSLLKESDILLKNELYNGSINRSYYAIFNAIRALLALVELDSSKHSGVLSFFDKYFVKTGIVDKRFSEIAHSSFDIREDTDYKDFYESSEKDAISQFNDAKDFITEIEGKIEKFISGDLSLPEVIIN